ncbi:unnamed protein product [Polarella glacialis]|uniref:Pentatricopeptide repeat-containing protein n=1 Tax=Polarella glacialis TaxID=89957 RepID=A0A813IQ90_POLGL|nr:unnamed protein product [Polarella glacialis]
MLLGTSRPCCLHFRGAAWRQTFCGALISACEKARQWERALWILHSMGRWRAEPDVIAYNAAMSACGKAETLLVAQRSRSTTDHRIDSTRYVLHASLLLSH